MLTIVLLLGTVTVFFPLYMAILIAFNYGVINTLIDILYGVIDPRVRSK